MRRVLLARESVVGGIDADGFEDLGVFAQALALKPGLGELAPVFVAAAVVKHPAPAGVFPRGRADVNALRRQGDGSLGQFLPVEVHAVMIKPLGWGLQSGWEAAAFTDAGG